MLNLKISLDYIIKLVNDLDELSKLYIHIKYTGKDDLISDKITFFTAMWNIL